jgi:hypothetical protein
MDAFIVKDILLFLSLIVYSLFTIMISVENLMKIFKSLLNN